MSTPEQPARSLHIIGPGLQVPVAPDPPDVRLLSNISTDDIATPSRVSPLTARRAIVLQPRSHPPATSSLSVPIAQTAALHLGWFSSWSLAHVWLRLK